MLGWALNLDFAGTEVSAATAAGHAGLLLVGVGLLRVLALV